MDLKVASVSMCSGESPDENLAVTLRYLRQARELGADWIVFPENLFFVGDYKDLRKCRREGKFQSCLKTLQDEAKSMGMVLFAGTVPEADSRQKRADEKAERCVSTLHAFDRQGNALTSYEKAHLFTLRTPSGELHHDEGQMYSPGGDFKVVDLDGMRVGLGICYDLRFSGMFLAMEKRGGPLDVIILPSAFTYQTGKDHWEVLLRARAIEHQCYVVASNQTGFHPNGRQTWGHSMVIDPWGHVLATTGALPGMAVASVHKSRVQETRQLLQAVSDRRWDLY